MRWKTTIAALGLSVPLLLPVPPAESAAPPPPSPLVPLVQIAEGKRVTVLPLDAVPPAHRAQRAGPALKIDLRDLNGNARPPQSMSVVTSLDDPAFGSAMVGPGERISLAPGRYSVTAWIATYRPGNPVPAAASITNPLVRVDRDQTITLDARRARRITLGVQRPTARVEAQYLHALTRAPRGAGYRYHHAILICPPGAEVYAGSTAAAPHFIFAAGATVQEPEIRLDVDGPPRFPVDLWYLGRSHLLGTRRQQAAYGGKGAPEELRNVRGKLVVLDLAQGDDDQVPARVSNVARAGGRAVLVVGERWPQFNGDLPLPTMFSGLSQAGRLRDLVKSGPVAVTTRGIRVSPYAYEFLHPTVGRVPDRLVFTPRDKDLGAARVTYRGAGGPLGNVALSKGSHGFGASFGSMMVRSIPDGTVRTEFFSTAKQVRFRRTLFSLDRDDLPYDVTASRTFRPGERLTEAMFKGVLGPSLSSVPEDKYGVIRPGWVYRKGNTLDVEVPLFSSTEPGHFGRKEGRGSTRLYRDGRLVGRTGEAGLGAFTAPATAGRYRLDVQTSVDHASWRVSRAVKASWTFRSTRTGRATALPLMAVRYVPALDRHNRAPGGRVFSFPVRVEHQVGSAAARVTSLRVQASLDDGTTWRPVRLHKVRGLWVAELRNPARGHVSLQSFAKDADGNTVSQTILRAYVI